MLDAHDGHARRRLEDHRGRFVKTTGDGLLATFDGPARGIRCAAAMRDEPRPLRLEMRAGLHVGEVEVRGEDIGGIAVHIAARVQEKADPGEVLVSRTITRDGACQRSTDLACAVVMAQKQICESAHEAVADIGDGASLLVHSFGPPQAWPTDCLLALAERGVGGLTVICNTPAGGPTSLTVLAAKKQIRKLVCSYVGSPAIPTEISEQVKAGEIECEMVPQGTLVERVRAGGAGLAGFFTPTGVGTDIAAGKEERVFDGKPYVFERAIRADFALLQAHRADTAGNLVYRGGMRNFGPAFAMAGRTTIAEVKEILPPGAIDPEVVVTPGIFVDRVVKTTTQLDVGVLRQILLSVGRVTDMEGRPAGDGGPVGLPADLMAMKAATLLRAGEYVNLGIGLPTLVSNYIAGRDITLHSENGILGFGPLAGEGEENIDLYNASGQFITAVPGTSYFDSTVSFAMARSGRVSTIVLGAFQVSQYGDLANWSTPKGSGGIGGAMDLAAGGARVIALCYHRERGGPSKLVAELGYPATARRCVRAVVTDLAWIDVDADGFLLREIAPGLTVDDIKTATAAAVRVARDVKEMQFE